MYDYLEADELLPVVTTSISDLQESEIEGEEATTCAEALEQIHRSLVPSDVQDDANRVVSAAAVTMLTDYGDCLSLDDIESVVTALCEFGADKNAAAAAAQAALEAHINNLSDMKELNSLDELESHEKQLETLINSHGLPNERVVSLMKSSIQTLKERLVEKEERDNESYYRGGLDDTSAAQISNDEIRSIFGQLRSSGTIMERAP